jgi:hypothetical protein
VSNGPEGLRWGDRIAESRLFWRGGPLSFAAWDAGPDAFGFQTIWLDP